MDVTAEDLRSQFDAVVLATGSRVPRDLPVPGRELGGVHFAMEYLYDRARCLDGNPPENPITAAGKHVLVVGGGDTGADCVGHSHREGAASVTQIELLGEPPERRPDDLTPWPRWPVKLRTSYALKEGGERDFAISTTQLTGNGSVQKVHWVQNEGKPPFAAIEGTDEEHPAQLVLLAMGFLGPEQELLDALGVERDARSNVKAGAYATLRRRRLRRRRRSPRPVADRLGDQRGPPVRPRGRPLPALAARDRPALRGVRGHVGPLRLARPRRRPASGGIQHVIVYLVALAIEGLLIGGLARLALPGRDPMSIWATMGIGIASVFIAGLIYYVISGGHARGGGFFASFVVAFGIVYFIRRRRGGDLTHPDGRR